MVATKLETSRREQPPKDRPAVSQWFVPLVIETAPLSKSAIPSGIRGKNVNAEISPTIKVKHTMTGPIKPMISTTRLPQMPLP